ncbi:hypothetical protein [Spiroplasma platyhelix]|uniref:Uncharacterized protein n=1 Tax=Spiroplasma platyhelix PALS-1 TaxID=1276218 RepID=A0A846U1R1_9MOLU|nr:hypothetical protein [Spiroplasma platyhelix]MBE4704079.1 hypothetical protein [Spiroplasma platyhelix PALS-1]NKE38449.1 hypothetical protein [Spiroplasma platyhelix PALS-1]UJB29337.1 hypothetical protein SPLAT_v1c05730 [Spiroplasma platyhelix PALS-1]
MEDFNQKEHEKIYQTLKQSVLAVPGVASIAKNKNDNLKIDINKNNLGWIVNININCFSYVNIWSVMRQVQNQAKYIIEKISKHKENVEINVNVFDLIEEDIY